MVAMLLPDGLSLERKPMDLSTLPQVEGVEYRWVPRFRGYAVGSDGTPWSCRRGKWKRLKTHPGGSGYPYVTMFDDNSA